jgi:hypothetical protein
MAETHPGEFIDTVHDFLKSVFDTNDEFLKRSVLSELTAAHTRSKFINSLLVAGIIMQEVDTTIRLKCADILHAMEHYGHQIVFLTPSAHGSKKLKQHCSLEAREQKVRFGIRLKDPHGGKKLLNYLKAELLEQIRGQELPDNLYDRITKQDD